MSSLLERPTHPLATLDARSIAGALRAVGSRDPDVLHAKRTRVSGRLRATRRLAVGAIAAGALASLAPFVAAVLERVGSGGGGGVPSAFAPAGIALLALGCWAHRRASRNLDAVRTGFAEYARSAGIVLALCLGCLGPFSGCGGDDDSNPGGPGDGDSAMTAKIGGVPFASDAIPGGFGATQAAPGLYVIGGQQVVSATNFRSITITVYNVGGPGTYPLGVGPQVFGGTAIVVEDGAGWGTPLSGAAGTITITELTAARIAGTFTFTATASTGGATGSKAVTEGVFDFPIVVSGTSGPLPDHAGSRIEGMVGDALWNAAVIATAAPMNGNFIFSATNDSRSISMTLTQYAGEGVYPLGTLSPLRMVAIMGPSTDPTGESCCWNVPDSAVGDITITSATATRIVGTIDALLQPSPGSNATGPIEIVGLEFDLGITPFP